MNQGTTQQMRRRPALEARDLKIAFGSNQVLRGVSADLRPGQVALLQGDNGSGKTTLLNILTGNLQPDAGSLVLRLNHYTERFDFAKGKRKGLLGLSHYSPERLAGEGVGRLWQEIRLFGTLSLRENIAVATQRQPGESAFTALARRRHVQRTDKKNLSSADRRLRDFGLTGRERSSADMVSLGQAKRAAIARSLQGGARVLFLDEPLAGLDAEGVEGALEILAALKKSDVALVIVEHALNMARLLPLVDVVWTLHEGRLIVESSREAGQRSGREVEVLSRLLQEGDSESSTLAHHEWSGATLVVRRGGQVGEGRPLLEVRDLEVRRGPRTVLGSADTMPVSFELYAGDLAVLAAPNGWGKTTLLECLAGLLSPTRGTIRIKGSDALGLSASARSAAGLSLMRSVDNIFPSLTVKEALSIAGMTETPKALAGLAQQRGETLSGGERQRLAFACALGGAAEILLLDEPFGMLDAAGVEETVSWLQGKKSGCALLGVPASV